MFLREARIGVRTISTRGEEPHEHLHCKTETSNTSVSANRGVITLCCQALGHDKYMHHHRIDEPGRKDYWKDGSLSIHFDCLHYPC